MATEMPTPAQPPEDFQTAFCRHFKCPARAFEKKMFRECVEPEVRPLAVAIRRLAPRLFKKDIECLQRVGRATSLDKIILEANALSTSPWLNQGFLHGIMKVRISDQRIVQLARQILG